MTILYLLADLLFSVGDKLYSPDCRRHPDPGSSFTFFFLPAIYVLLISLLMEKNLQKYTTREEDGSDERSRYLEA